MQLEEQTLLQRQFNDSDLLRVAMGQIDSIKGTSLVSQSDNMSLEEMGRRLRIEFFGIDLRKELDLDLWVKDACDRLAGTYFGVEDQFEPLTEHDNTLYAKPA